MRKEELRTYIENHESEMIEDLKSLIRIPSEKQAAEPGKTIRRTGGRSTGAGNRNSGKIRLCRNQLRQLRDCS